MYSGTCQCSRNFILLLDTERSYMWIIQVILDGGLLKYSKRHNDPNGLLDPDLRGCQTLCKGTESLSTN